MYVCKYVCKCKHKYDINVILVKGSLDGKPPSYKVFQIRENSKVENSREEWKRAQNGRVENSRVELKKSIVE